MSGGVTRGGRRQLLRQSIGIEINEHYCEIAAERLGSRVWTPLMEVAG